MARRVMIVGGGAREHALASAMVRGGHEVLVAPGNAGTARIARNLAIRADDIAQLLTAAERERPDLVVVGPEIPLTLGLVDALAERGIAAFGPSRAAAELEASKVFMKRFLARHGVPTAAFEVFDDADAAAAYVRAAARPLVVKADGLAAGKGVVVASNTDEALAAIDAIMRARTFGDAGAQVVIEELLPGEEASFHVVADGERYVALAAAQDHKRVGEGDRGPNTGGMGAYAPAPVVTDAIREKVLRTVIEPTLEGLRAEGRPFRGALFAGLMIDGDAVRVLEFNVRFGDPETCVLVPLYRGDWYALLEGAARGDLGRVIAGGRADVTEEAALCVVMAAEGYPGKVTTGDRIAGLDAPPLDDTDVFHAGTSLLPDGSVVTSGGRVLTVAGRAETLDAAAERAYAAVDRLGFRGEHHRGDIGHRARARNPRV